MSTMKNHLYSLLSRLALCGLAAPLILLLPAFARADAITTFDVSGTAQNVSRGTLDSCANNATCAFSGTFQVDTTTGMVESSSLGITFPGLPTFTFPGNCPPGLCSRSIGSGWEILEFNSNDFLDLIFTTAPTPGSLVGFTGGLISNMGSVKTNGAPARSGDPSPNPLYLKFGGRITPVPEPSSVVLFTSGLLVLGLTRRFGKKIGHPLSA